MATSKIFFSYSRLDSDFALQLAKDIRASGADIWIDQLDIQAGNHWDAAVEKALATSACVLVILTPSSTSSTNVMDEVSFALESGKKIIPVLLEDCLPPFRLRRLQRIDFTKDYKAGLAQLLVAIEVPSPVKIEVTDGKDEATASAPDTEKKAKDDAASESRLWDTACKLNTIAGYEKYLKDMVTGEFKAEAQLLIHQLTLEQKEDEQEASAWKKAKAEHTLQAYQQYLQAYPDRNYKSLALAAIVELEAIQKEEQRKQDARRKEEQMLADKKREEERLEAKRLEEKKQEEKREEARQLEEKKKEEKRIEEQKKMEKRAEEQRQEEIRKEQKRQEALQKEKEKQEARQKEKEKQDQQKREAAKTNVPGATTVADNPSGKRNIMIVGGVVILAFLIWLLTGLGGGNSKDAKAWTLAKEHGDSIAIAAYMAQYPKGKYYAVAQQRIDSIHLHRQATRDSLANVALAQSKQDSLGSTPAAPVANAAPNKSTPTVAKPKPTVATPAKVVSPYKLGQAFGGGLIAFIDKTGMHGLIAAEKDLGYLTHDNAAKKSSKFTGGNNHDWRLPSKEELIALYQARKQLSIDAHGSYWSATADKDNFFWAFNMSDGKSVSFNKSTALFVRAVRTF
jgi:hypothetical protein